MKRLCVVVCILSLSLMGCSRLLKDEVVTDIEETTDQAPEPVYRTSQYGDEEDIRGLATSLDNWSIDLVDYDIMEYLQLSKDAGLPDHYDLYLSETPGVVQDDLLSLAMLYFNLRYCPEYVDRSGIVIWEDDNDLANLFGFQDAESLDNAITTLRRNPLRMFEFFSGEIYGNQIATYDLRYIAPSYSLDNRCFRYPGDAETVFDENGVVLSRNRKHAVLTSANFQAVPVLYKDKLYYICLGGDTNVAVAGDITFGSKTVDGIPVSIYCDWQSVLDAMTNAGYVTQNEFVMFANVNYAVFTEDFLLDVAPEELRALLQPLVNGVDWNALCASYGKYVHASDVNIDNLFYDYFGFRLDVLDSSDEDVEEDEDV